ncbi:hypothetical protein [Planomonospora sp. ID91781]|uniref:hypothetical protein n=1 Tax=Planomonospora sp. ID91781 TaxID=2738135 RepID=UPI001E3C9915|nr:hypothetical protein [Planomonospora sp. ID91781]
MRAFVCVLALTMAAAGCGSGPESAPAQAPPQVPAAGTAVNPARPDEAKPDGADKDRTPDRTPGGSPDGSSAGGAEVSPEQHRILTGQCRYADTAGLREECLAAVRRGYRVGRENRDLDCRTYSGVTVCGRLPLSERERGCVEKWVTGGLTQRRAEVECYVFS